MMDPVFQRPPFLTDLLDADERAAVIGRFYEKVYADPLLAPRFVGVERSVQEQRLAGFIQMTCGRISTMQGEVLRNVHARLGLTPAHFARRAELLAEAITEAGHGAEVLACWRRYDARWWRHIRV
jgi:truncated hemoglobin YjbI